MVEVLTINRTPKDYVAKTRHLSVEDRGAYQEILDQIVLLGQHENPPSIPDDDRFIANLLGWSVGKWRKSKVRLCHGSQAVLVAEGGRISQSRIVEEIEAARTRMAGSSKAGVASGAARRANAVLRERMLNERSASVEREREQKPNGMRTDSEPAMNHESRVMNHELGELLSPESRRCRGNTSGGGDNGWTPPWSERQFQFKADKIARWLKDQITRGVVPDADDEDFNAEFTGEWGMSYARWLEVRPKCEAFYSHLHAEVTS